MLYLFLFPAPVFFATVFGYYNTEPQTPAMITSLASLSCLSAAIIVLLVLTIIDLRVRLLPNVWNLALAALAVIFHFTTGWIYLGPVDAFFGLLNGGLTLLLIRFVADRFYGEETIGLGDVKLMMAGGLWLGPQMIMLAMSIGAVAGFAGGLLSILYLRHVGGDKTVTLKNHMLPAGPGFAAGIGGVGAWYYATHIETSLHDLWTLI